MTNACEKWNEPLRDAALTGTAAKELEEHLSGCAKCSAELEEVRARAARLDALLPLVVQSAEPSVDFRTRVLAAAEARGEGKRGRPWRLWTLAGVAAVVVVVLMISVSWQRRTGGMIPRDELTGAQKLAEWRAPSDALLATPGQEMLRKMPRLGESYLNVPVKKNEEE
jgi:anti-sigma factor RsiW